MSEKIVIFLSVAVIFALLLVIPALIAMMRKHPERQLIYKLSPLSIFSFILWGALVIWASSDRRDDAVISKYVAKLRKNNRLSVIVSLLVAIGLVGGGLAFSL